MGKTKCGFFQMVKYAGHWTKPKEDNILIKDGPVSKAFSRMKLGCVQTGRQFAHLKPFLVLQYAAGVRLWNRDGLESTLFAEQRISFQIVE
jgi:hypothetical protein